MLLAMDDVELMSLAQRIVRKSAARFGLDQHVVEDLAQEVLARYFAEWGRSKAPNNPPAWLQRVADNAINDHMRQGQRRPADGFAPGGDDAVAMLVATLRANGTAGAASLMPVKEALLDEVFALVSQADAAVLKRRFADGTPAADLAAEYGITRAAIDQRTARAKKRMANALKGRPDLLDALKSGHQHPYQSDHRFPPQRIQRRRVASKEPAAD